MKERLFNVTFTRRGRSTLVPVSTTSAIRAMEAVLRTKLDFTDQDNVRDFCVKHGCHVRVSKS